MSRERAMKETSRPALSPFCADLRSKKTYFLPAPPQTEADILDASQHCWCSRTMMALGPDKEPVDPEACRTGRNCFRPV